MATPDLLPITSFEEVGSSARSNWRWWSGLRPIKSSLETLADVARPGPGEPTWRKPYPRAVMSVADNYPQAATTSPPKPLSQMLSVFCKPRELPGSPLSPVGEHLHCGKITLSRACACTVTVVHPPARALSTFRGGSGCCLLARHLHQCVDRVEWGLPWLAAALLCLGLAAGAASRRAKRLRLLLWLGAGAKRRLLEHSSLIPEEEEYLQQVLDSLYTSLPGRQHAYVSGFRSFLGGALFGGPPLPLSVVDVWWAVDKAGDRLAAATAAFPPRRAGHGALLGRRRQRHCLHRVADPGHGQRRRRVRLLQGNPGR